MPRGARRPDFASRLKGRVRTLRARVESREALMDALRAANASVDPAQVAAAIARQAAGWIPAPCWAVVGPDGNEGLAVLAHEGLSPDAEPAVWAAAHWVLRQQHELFAANVADEAHAPEGVTGTAIAFPLICRGRTVGALVAVDPAPSATRPSLGPSLLLALRELLEPGAIALEHALALQRAEALSVTDDLTRLFNSRYLNLVLKRETKRATRGGRPLSLLFIDLDGFKQVNDTHGHLAGSKALVEAADIIRASARETDVVARFGGDEFSLVLPDTGREGAVAVAERIRDRFRAHRFLHAEGLEMRVTASIGVATLPDAAGSAEELVRAADIAMYRVKAAGKDGIHVAQDAG